MESAEIKNEVKEIISEWVEIYTDELLAWAFQKTGHKDLAEDMVQDTFLSAIRAFSSFQGNSNPKTWLIAILNNKIIDHHRKKASNIISNSYDQFFNEGSDDVFDELGRWKKEYRPKKLLTYEMFLDNDGEFFKLLYSCMKRLPELWYSIVQLTYLEEKKGSLICKELNISSSNYWQILRRSRIQLRACIEKKWEIQ